MANRKDMLSLELERGMWYDFSDALADSLCWFRGFAAARGTSEDLPSGMERLANLNTIIKGKLARDA